MQTDRWERIEQLCQEALERPQDQQAAFLESTCGADQELRHEVESLLAHRQRAENFIEAPAMHMAARALAEEQRSSDADKSRHIGRVISYYRIVEKVASGGMGDVFRAVRADGTYEKQVAIKLIQGSRSTDFFLSRFQNERQILANLDHPNIACLLDGGTTEAGLPFVVMEYIQGLPIDDYCTQKSLTVRERLELFRTVCSAVQYAHQNLVVHRDLKPSNILVTEEGVPKLLDFGIAKILHSQRGEENLQTVTMLPMLTPDYASPEQVRNERISTTSDVYSLGVILYVLLTGRSPYRASTDSPQEMMKAICDTEPERPSAVAMVGRVVETTSDEDPASLGSSPRPMQEKPEKLRKVLAGDLDNIVLKALRKEAQRRYPSVEQFSDDIRRYLTGLPVLAHKDTLGYRSRKFIGRHTLGVGAVSLLVLSLTGGLTATLWQARIARANQLRAERRFNDVRRLANSLIFDIHDSVRDLPGSTAPRKLIVETALQYLDALARESRNDSALQRELATAYERVADVEGNPYHANIGDTAGAMSSYQKALVIREALARDHPKDPLVQTDLASSYAKTADMLSFVGKNDEALEKSRKALPIRQSLAASDPTSQSALWGLAELHRSIGDELIDIPDWPFAEREYKNALAGFEALSTAHPDTVRYRRMEAVCHLKIGNVYESAGGIAGAQQEYRQGIEILRQLVAADPMNVLLQRNLATALLDMGDTFIALRNANGIKNLHDAAEITESLAARDPADLQIYRTLSLIYLHLGDAEARIGNTGPALGYYTRSLEAAKKRAKGDPQNAEAREIVANRYLSLGKLYQAMANNSDREASNGRRLWQNARSFFQEALSYWLDLKSRGPLSGQSIRTVEELQQRLRECAAALKKLS